MEKHACKTYFSVNFEIDIKKNVELLRERRDCLPEELGIFNKTEVERFIVENLGEIAEWRRHRFVIGCNEDYDIDVNNMLRVTLKNLFGKQDEIKEMQQKFSVTTWLVVVPRIVADSGPYQYLSPERDIIEFLYASGTSLDLDYYII